MVAIAIIGIGCRYPGGIVDSSSFWDFLVRKGDAVTEIPDLRWDVDRYYDPDPEAPGRMYTRHASFVDEPFARFDSDFFGISRREAATLDPQQRRLLQVSWEALDDAGVAGHVSGGSVGTFIGGFTNDNAVGKAGSHALDRIDNFAATSSSQTLLSNRIAYTFDLHGPSLTVDTACSSSLVATHLGVRAIADGECDIALVGGSNVIFQPETFITMCKGRFLSVDGRCKSFDASADGYGRGEGVGVVVLKNLENAVRDRDRIYAVIRGSGVNQDGRTLALPVPNPDSQYALARKVAAEAEIDPALVGYVEAHGTGTGVGDPLEASALGRAYGMAEGRTRALRMGSVKNNFGHTEAAAGVAGLIKAALTVREGRVAPQAYLENPNPEIAFEELRLTVPLEVEDLDGIHAGVNSFGYGGTNAHVLVERAPEPVHGDEARDTVRVFPVSARSEESLRRLARGYGDLLRSPSGVAEPASPTADSPTVDAASGGGVVDVPRVKAAVVRRRAHHHLRRGFVYRDAEDLVAQLDSFASGEGKIGDRVLVEGLRSPVFVFSGMGPQWWAMGRTLLVESGRFRDTAQAIDAEFRKIAGWSILDEMLADEDDSRIARTDIAQPANFLIQVALVDHLAQWGVHPAAVVGHSVGEVSAAYVSGVLSLTDALTVAYHRSRLQAQTAGSGGMLAVGLGPDEARQRFERFGDAVSIAAVNGATAVTLAGLEGPLEELREELTGEGMFARRLRVEVPYHSHLMDPILGELAEVLSGLTPREPTVPVYSTVTGGLFDAREFADPGYWCRNVRDTVRFADAIDALIDERFRVFLEVGPHPVLVGNIREAFVRHSVSGAGIGTLHRDEDAESAALAALAELYRVGAVDTPGEAAMYQDTKIAHLDLPPYPWLDLEMWEENIRTVRARHGDPNRYALLGDRTDSLESEWELTLAPANLPWLRDHNVGGAVVLPGAGYIDAALAAARQRSSHDQCGVDALAFVAPLIVSEHDVPVMRVAVENAAKRLSIKARSGHGDLWTQHAFGRLVEMESGSYQLAVPAEEPGDIAFDHDEIYAAMDALGLAYGPAFRRIRRARVRGTTCVAELDTRGLVEGGSVPDAPHVVHPALTDAAFQCAAVLLAASSSAQSTRAVAHVPAAVDRVRLFGPIPDELLAVVSVVSTEPLRVDAFLTDRNGEVALALYGAEFAPIGVAPDPLDDLERLFYERRWEDLPALPPNDQSRAINVAVTIGSPAETVLSGMTQGPIEPLRIAWDTDPDDTAAVDAATKQLTEALARDGYLRIGLAAGPGYDAAELAYRVVAFARVVSAASAERLDGDLADFDVRVVIVTTNGMVGPGDTELDPAHAALVGLRRTLAQEQNPIGWAAIDTDGSVSSESLVAELIRGTTAESDEIRLRGEVRSAERVQRSAAEFVEQWDVPNQLSSPDEAYEVVLPRTRLLKDLTLRACDRVAPGPREVEVRVETIGLNYKDPLKVLGILTERQLSGTYFGTVPGMEGYGVVTRVGSEITDIEPGDAMAVATRGLLRRYTLLDVDGGGAWVRAPRAVLGDHQELDPLAIGSGLPYITAYYSLRTLADLGPGDSVLIHGAAGGMGMAAVQVAASLGATVFATAGSAERRAAAVDIGATHVLDSRSSSFVDEVLRLTDGRGVDVVYNSMPGEVISQDFTVAAEFGRIIEIGKADVYFGGTVDLRPFNRNLSFYSIDMDRLLAQRPERFRQLMQECVVALAQGSVKPLPYVRFPITELSTAFETVLRASQVGRVVVDLRTDTPEVLPQRPAALSVRPDATYLITGGFGAFGLATARALVQRGATRLVLVGRRGVGSDDIRRQLEVLAARGVDVVCESADVSDPASVGRLLDTTADPERPLRGVFHTAGVIADEPVADISAATIGSVFAPKVGGAQALDAATRERGLDLDAFVLYSSISAITGTIPQASYVAANTTLDAFAAARRASGSAVTSVNWGAMAGGGMAEASLAVTKYLEMLGFNPLDLDRGAGLLFDAARFGQSNLMLADVDWATWRGSNRVAASSGRFEEVVDEVPESQQAAAARQMLLNLPPEERAPAVIKVIVEQLSEVLGVEAESIDTRGPIADLGIDSVMGVEFGARVQKQLDVQMSVFQFTGDLTIESIAARVVKLLEQEQEKA
ncbi:SDR family NAD(P)-dependent oxidoreductase [Nocardia sp. CA2R105]|uniref:type I polyketide synthase n=1 Tax=Nocardia coffeae TaxID=2873381 RepID=UPI001CA7098E|nr:type I polyketide synthase [Nocardia coffeae]MBY8862079.1 SDR family NAD(P)-dependent oxidoreductase [Nocardia coffeae]